MATATKATATQEVTLPRPDIQTVTIHITGISPLISHAWSQKAIQMMLNKQLKKATAGREAKDPEADFQASLYPHPDGGYGFPATAFKSAMVRAGTYTDEKMTFLRGAFYVVGQDDLVKINGTPTPREDMVRVGMGTADIRYRGQFVDWTADLVIQFNATAISAEKLANLISVAGFSVGVGDWRPEKDGSFGRWTIG